MKSFDLSDPYVRRARLQPALIVVLPIAVAILAWSPTGVFGWGLLWSLIAWCGGTFLLAQIGRDWGRQKQPALYQSWSGKPTTRFLRHRDAPNKVILSRRHRKLKQLVKGVSIPTAEEESKNPTAADDVYDACTAFLLEKTRSKTDFPLIFDENCNYGFRRNLWGLKPLGITASVLGMLIIAALLILEYRHGTMPAAIVFVCVALDVLILLGWLFWFTPNWVRTAAEAYAERLLAACESL